MYTIFYYYTYWVSSKLLVVIIMSRGFLFFCSKSVMMAIVSREFAELIAVFLLGTLLTAGC